MGGDVTGVGAAAVERELKMVARHDQQMQEMESKVCDGDGGVRFEGGWWRRVGGGFRV